MTIDVYTDGSQRTPGPENQFGLCGWAYRYELNGKTTENVQVYRGKYTGFEMELTAVIYALEDLIHNKLNHQPVIIYSDATDFTDAIKNGTINKWSKRAWHNITESAPLKDQLQWVKINQLILQFDDLSVQHVIGKGTNTNPINKEVDNLIDQEFDRVLALEKKFKFNVD